MKKAVIPRFPSWYPFVFWILQTILWAALFSIDFKDYSITMVYTAIVMVAQLIASYTVIYVLIPRFLYQHRYWLFSLLYLILLLCCGSIVAELSSRLFTTCPDQIRNMDYLNWGIQLVYGVLLALFSSTLMAGSKITFDRFRSEENAKQLEKEKLELEKEKLATELKFLKAQINPHFLFNILNSIYNLIGRQPEKARELLIQFSEMLRYHLYEGDTAQTLLSTEMGYVHSYAEMEKIRKGKNIVVQVVWDEPQVDVLIVPLVLLTFVENAFKHVSNHFDQPNIVEVQVHSTTQRLEIHIRNTRDKRVGPSGSGGIGEANVRRRLELTYPGRHSLHVEDGDEWYEVRLVIEPIM